MSERSEDQGEKSLSSFNFAISVSILRPWLCVQSLSGFFFFQLFSFSYWVINN